MNVGKYFKELNEATNKLTDAELERLLIKSGLDKCPYEDKSLRERYKPNSILCKAGIHKYTIQRSDTTIKNSNMIIKPEVKFCTRCGKLKEIR